jgi:hypothetical protein
MTLAPTAVAAVADGQLLALANIARGPERDPALVVEPVGAVLLRNVQQSGSPSSNNHGRTTESGSPAGMGQLARANAWASLHLLGQPNTFLATATVCGGRLTPCAAWLRRSSTGGTQSGKAPESPRDRIAATPARTGTGGEVT